MNMGFIQFERKKAGKMGLDSIKMRKGNFLSFPKRFCVNNELNSAQYIGLNYNREKKMIGLTFSNISNDNAYRLSKLKTVNIKTFLQFFDIKVEPRDYEYKIVYEKDVKYFTFLI